jgi:hypothetical protein
MKNFNSLFVALVVFFTPLSIRASEMASIGIFCKGKRPNLEMERGIILDSLVSDSSTMDKTAPLFNHCPANIVKTPTSAGICWAIDWTPPVATDNCGTPTIELTKGPTNGSCLDVGTYDVAYKATDAQGNVATCTFVISVNSYLNSNSITSNTMSNTVSKLYSRNLVTLHGTALVEKGQAFVVVCLLSNWLLKMRLFKVI